MPPVQTPPPPVRKCRPNPRLWRLIRLPVSDPRLYPRTPKQSSTRPCRRFYTEFYRRTFFVSTISPLSGFRIPHRKLRPTSSGKPTEYC
ncbi:unnamed protein product [Tenebrio molitor]|nr:unnamed protein product [Tenebrio molitor]